MEINKITKAEYPITLRNIPSIPESMDIIGSLPSPEHKYLCVVGARKFSDYGKDACTKLIAGLNKYPIVIVSGLAFGIDSIAHEAALEAGMKTVAFPGSGLKPENIYPRAHLGLAERIIENGGALLSPFKPDQVWTSWTFPFRNRLMAGISHATLIIEARAHSGTLLTADYAMEFGRDVMTVPGSIFSDLSYGPHMLIKRGAIPITSSEDILEALGFDLPKGNLITDKKSDVSFPQNQSLLDLSLSPHEKMIVDHLRHKPLSSSDLIEKIAIPSSMFNIIISELELRGVVLQSEGIYQIKHN
jgi:DNA processing protein